MTQEIKGLDEAQKLYDANVSPRARTLITFESEVEGTRFDGRVPWTTTTVPIYDRRPAIVYKAVESSIQSKVDLLLGDGRFPTITSRPDEDESEDGDNSDGLNENQSEIVDALIRSIIKECKLRKLFRESYAAGQGCGTAIALIGARRGRLFAETLPAKWATPKRDANREIESVTIEYPYIKNERIDGVWRAKCYLYRRVIDASFDTTFKPAEATKDGNPPAWAVESRVSHGLGFCPVVWYRHNAPMMNLDSEDGYPVHRTLLPELEAIDLALSQRHHGALTSLPQIFEIGVEPGYNPTDDGDTGATVEVTEHGGAPNPVSNPVRGSFKTQVRRVNRGARKKGPNHTWQYPSESTKVGAINTPGDALKAITEHIHDLRNKICETLAWVPLDPDSIRFAATVSGKALEILRERELNRVSRDRETFGEDFILAVICMSLRVAVHLGASLQTRKLRDALPVLATMVSGGTWQDPMLCLRWPEYFLQSAEDNQKTVSLCVDAYDSGIITRRTQVETVARIFGIENVGEYLEALNEEQAERQSKQEAESKAALVKLHAAGMPALEDDDADDSGEGIPAKGKQPRNSES